MAALCVRVQLGADPCFLQRHEVFDGVFNVYAVVLCLHEEGRRRGSCHRNVRTKRKILVSIDEISGIENDREVRTAAQLIGRIHCRI